MNICLLSDKYPPDPGGLAISAQRLARGLAATGHTVHVAVISQAVLPGQVTCSQEGDVLVHRLGAYRRIDDTRANWFEYVTRLHRQLDFDILHGYYLAGAGFVTVYAGRYLDRPTVISARGNDLDRTAFKPEHLSPIVWALVQAGAVTAVSGDLARKARALAPQCRVQVIHNGVETDHFQPAPPDLALKTSLGLAPQTPVVGFVGEARLKKGLAILLPAFAQVVEGAVQAGQPVPALLLIGGVRSDDAGLWQVFKSQHPNLQLHTLPYTAQAQLAPFYHLLDVLALPSLREGLPNALLEGMACGCAIVATETGGMPEVVRHEENGLLIPPGDIAALAGAIANLLAATPERRAALGQAARQTVRRDFTPAQELAQNLALYRQLS